MKFPNSGRFVFDEILLVVLFFAAFDFRLKQISCWKQLFGDPGSIFVREFFQLTAVMAKKVVRTNDDPCYTIFEISHVGDLFQQYELKKGNETS